MYDNLTRTNLEFVHRQAEKRIAELEKLSKAKTQQLTKAKEHIENLLYYVQQCTCERSNYAEMDEDIKQAAQFLKEIE